MGHAKTARIQFSDINPLTSTRLASRLNSRRRSDPGFRWVPVVMAALATVGAIDTGSITLKRWGVLGSLACPGGGEGCDKVLNSAWGTVLGQPLSLFGFLAYIAVLVLALLPLVWRIEVGHSALKISRFLLFLLSTGMAVFSLILMGVMVLKIQAFCAFCVLSAVLSLVLMLLSFLNGDWDDRGQLLFSWILVALVVTVGSFAWSASIDRSAAVTSPGAPPAIKASSTPGTIALAEHLTASGASMYSAYWCPHCHDQKELFGKEASAKLNIVECAADGQNSQKELCETKKLTGFPTWEINGRLDSGVKSLQRLADLSDFSGDKSF